jgi:hypothetical protein
MQYTNERIYVYIHIYTHTHTHTKTHAQARNYVFDKLRQIAHTTRFVFDILDGIGAFRSIIMSIPRPGFQEVDVGRTASGN